MSSSNRSFTPEELSALTPWRLPSLDDLEETAEGEAVPCLTSVEAEIEAAPRLTVEEIEAMQRQARDEAAAQG
ncbi:MAG: flagellar assembly protein FliH, partial [Methylohalobius sp.]|nr:flagellar assembly protein FliH [Methylohalobius sp.]